MWNNSNNCNQRFGTVVRPSSASDSHSFRSEKLQRLHRWSQKNRTNNSKNGSSGAFADNPHGRRHQHPNSGPRSNHSGSIRTNHHNSSARHLSSRPSRFHSEHRAEQRHSSDRFVAAGHYSHSGKQQQHSNYNSSSCQNNSGRRRPRSNDTHGDFKRRKTNEQSFRSNNLYEAPPASRKSSSVPMHPKLVGRFFPADQQPQAAVNRQRDSPNPLREPSRLHESSLPDPLEQAAVVSACSDNSTAAHSHDPSATECSFSHSSPLVLPPAAATVALDPGTNSGTGPLNELRPAAEPPVRLDIFLHTEQDHSATPLSSTSPLPSADEHPVGTSASPMQTSIDTPHHEHTVVQDVPAQPLSDNAKSFELSPSATSSPPTTINPPTPPATVHQKITNASPSSATPAEQLETKSESPVASLEVEKRPRRQPSHDPYTEKLSPGDPSLVQIGDRLAVYWDGDDAFFHAIVTRERPHKKKRFFLEYDDGDDEWINLKKVLFYIIPFEELDIPIGEQTATEIESTTVKAVAKSSSLAAKDENIVKAKELGPSDWMADDNWVMGAVNSEKEDEDEAENDEEFLKFAAQMLGAPRPASNTELPTLEKPVDIPETNNIADSAYPLHLIDERDYMVHIPISEKVKLGRRKVRPQSLEEAAVEDVASVKNKLKLNSKSVIPGESKMNGEAFQSTKPRKKLKDNAIMLENKHRKDRTPIEPVLRQKQEFFSSSSAEAQPKERKFPGQRRETTSVVQEKKRRKEEARTLSAAEVKAILGEDSPCKDVEHWVRRSARMPSRSVLNTPLMKDLLNKLCSNDPDMVVLKLKKYIPDPNAPQVALDAALDALEDNTNCESLYIQNYNEGMRDEQVLKLLKILQRPSCKIWCLNIGETYKVRRKTWKKFARGLRKTKVTHMYASEHTISPELKEFIRITIRENRSKHNMHIDPDNLDTIIRCTHCWWNPINAKVLRPHLHARGYAHILNDEEAQGLRGTKSAQNLI